MGQMQTVSKNNTMIFGQHSEGKQEIEIYLHKTCVVQFNDERIILKSGGWHTATTRVRMNQASNQFNLGYRVFQKDFEWFVTFNGKELEFSDGMILNR